jgi:hypothetical protein
MNHGEKYTFRLTFPLLQESLHGEEHQTLDPIRDIRI